MFSSTTNANPFPHLSPSYHHHLSPPPFLDATNFFLHHHDHHSDLFMADTLLGMVNQAASTEPNGQSLCPKSMLPKTKKAVMRKHKQTKIFTAQGLRDRRVRLSIETARKFFDLQDMLGFEKASKTIDWLLKNSKTEIKDLLNEVKEKRSTFDYEVVSRAYGGTTNMEKLKISSVVKGVEDKLQKDRAAFDDRYLASRASRARARERARERTREKILRSKLKGSPISSDDQTIPGDNFKFVPNFGRPVLSSVNGNVVQELCQVEL